MILECVQLAICGGPDWCSDRGMSLDSYSRQAQNTLKSAFDLTLLIASQESLVARAKKIYNAKAIEKEVKILTDLLALKEKDAYLQQHGILDLMMKYDTF